MKCSAGSSAIYGIGMLGALVYFIQHATDLTSGILRILKTKNVDNLCL